MSVPRPAQRAQCRRGVRSWSPARLSVSRTPSQALKSYSGARRRNGSSRAKADGVQVIDSYAHHPTEASPLTSRPPATWISAKGAGVIAIFQPHLFSRTRIFAAEFGAALSHADEVLVLDVYAAREDPEPGVTGKLISDAVPGRGGAMFVPDRAHGAWRHRRPGQARRPRADHGRR